MMVTAIAMLFAFAVVLGYSRKQARVSIRRQVKQKLPPSKGGQLGFKHRLYVYASSLTWLMARLCGFVPSGWLRGFLYRHVFCARLSPAARVSIGCELICPWNIVLGAHSLIGIENKIDGRGGVVIGSNVNMSHQVSIWTMQHDVNDADFASVVGTVVIEDYVWLGNKVTVLPGVTVAKGCVVAAGAVVTKDTEEFGIYAGIPAKRVGERSRDLRYSIEFSPIF
ncbi:MAG: acyltransferase [Rhodocyclaceae bacterium]|nr:acyltransferase [Rhodocyclaceae bacterium]